MADYASGLIQALRGNSQAPATQSAVPGYELFTPQYAQATTPMQLRDFSGMAFNPQVQTHAAAPMKQQQSKVIETLRNFPVLTHPRYDGGNDGISSTSTPDWGSSVALGQMLSNYGMNTLGDHMQAEGRMGMNNAAGAYSQEAQGQRAAEAAAMAAARDGAFDPYGGINY